MSEYLYFGDLRSYIDETAEIEDARGRSSRTLMTAIVDLSTRDSNYKQDFYKDILRALLSQMGMYYTNDQNELVSVKIHHGRQDRLVAKKFQENNIVLPYSTVYQTGVQEDINKRRTSQHLIYTKAWNDKEQRAERVVHLADVPVVLTYSLSIWSKFVSDIDQLSASLRSKFNPDLILKIPQSKLCKAFLTQETDDGQVEARDREDRLIRKDFTINIEAYIPQPKFLVTNTGKILKLYTDVQIQD